MRRQYFSGEDPIGKRMRLWGKYREIAGIVSQVHHYGLDKLPEPTIYAPFEQMPNKAMALAVRTTLDTQAVVKAVKQAVWSVDPGQPVFQIRSMDDYLSLADAETLAPVTSLKRPMRLAVAVYLGKARLIDNIGLPRRS